MAGDVIYCSCLKEKGRRLCGNGRERSALACAEKREKERDKKVAVGKGVRTGRGALEPGPRAHFPRRPNGVVRCCGRVARFVP